MLVRKGEDGRLILIPKEEHEYLRDKLIVHAKHDDYEDEADHQT